MPRLPRYDAQRQLTTEGPSVPTSPEKMGMASGALARTGDAVSEVSKAWEKAQDVIQLTTAKNNLVSEKTKILAEAANDTDYNAYDKYKERLAGLSTQDDKISNAMAKDMFSIEKRNELAETDILLRNIFRKKQMDHQKAEIVRSETISKDLYINAMDPVQREKALGGYKNILASTFEAGMMTEEEYARRMDKTKEWDFDRALQDTGKNPQAVIDNLDSYNLTEKEKAQVVSAAKTQANQQRVIDDIRQAENQYANEKQMNEYILSGEDSVGVKLSKISELEINKSVGSTWASSARRYVNSVKRVDAKTNNETLNGLVRMVYDANEIIPDSKSVDSTNSKEYLQRITQIKAAIMDARSDGKLSADDETKITRKLESLTQKKLSQATAGIASDTGGWFGIGKSHYAVADEYFADNLPFYVRESALRQYFYETLDKEPNAKERGEILKKISAEWVNRKYPSTAVLEDTPNGVGGADGVEEVYPGGTALKPKTKADKNTVTLTVSGNIFEVPKGSSEEKELREAGAIDYAGNRP